MTAQQLAARMTREAADAILRSVRAMPEDKAAWKPLDEGRSALDQVSECGSANRWFAECLTHRALVPFPMEAWQREKAENDTIEKAASFCQSGTDALVSAIEAFPDVHLDDTLDLPFGGGITKSYREFFFFGYWNMTYHLGQINYIQTLYGDREMH